MVFSFISLKCMCIGIWLGEFRMFHFYKSIQIKIVGSMGEYGSFQRILVLLFGIVALGKCLWWKCYAIGIVWWKLNVIITVPIFIRGSIGVMLVLLFGFGEVLLQKRTLCINNNHLINVCIYKRCKISTATTTTTAKKKFEKIWKICRCELFMYKQPNNC